MDEFYEATLTLWPAAPVPAGVAEQLRRIGVDPLRPHVDGTCARSITAQGEVVLKLSLDGSRYGLTGLEGVLATARLAGMSYFAWDAKQGEIAGTGRSYDPAGGVEREFTVLANGEPVLTRGDLDSLEHYGSAEALLHEIRQWLRLPEPRPLKGQADVEVAITIEDDEREL